MKSDSALVLLKVVDLTVFIAALVLVVVPTGHLWPFSTFITSASASDTELFELAGNAPLTFHQLLSIQISLQSLLLTTAFVAYWHIVFSVVGLYSRERVGHNSPRDIIDFVTVAVLGVAAVWVASIVIDLARRAAQASLRDSSSIPSLAGRSLRKRAVM